VSRIRGGLNVGWNATSRGTVPGRVIVNEWMRVGGINRRSGWNVDVDVLW